MKYAVTVRPRSSQDKVVRNSDGTLKVYVRAAPVDGKANERVREVLADDFGVSKSAVKIVRGERSKEKVVEIW